MKTKLILIALLCSLLIIAISCQEEPATATLRVELDKGTRTIKPSEGSMEITGYRLVPTGPDGKVGSTKYTYYSYCNFDNMTYGQWKIEAFGFNSDRVDIAYGFTEVNISGKDNTAVIKVQQLVGEGSLKLNFTWNKEKIKNPILRLYLKAQDDNSSEIELTPSITKSEGTATVVQENLASGSYTLRGELFDGDKKVSGFIEAIRISNEKVSEATIPLELGKLEEEDVEGGSGSFDISNNTSSPIDLKIEGVEKIISKNASFTATLTILSKNVNPNQIKATWYLDGVAIGNGLSCRIKPEVLGEHRIDVVASASENGSTGSTYATFTSVTTTKSGMPYSLRQVSNKELSLGNDNIIRFLPTGRLILASNDLHTLEIISIDNNDIKVVKRYSYSELGIDSIVSDIAASGIVSDSNLTVYVFTNNEPSIIAISYSKTGDSLSFIGKQTNIKSNGGDKIENLGPAIGISNGGYLKTTAVAASTLNHGKKGVFFLYPEASSTDTNYVHANYIIEREFFGEGPIYSLDYSEKSDAITAISGSSGIVYQPRLTTGGQIAINPTPVIDDISKIEEQNFESLTRGLMGRIFDKDEGRGYILTHNALYVYQNNPSHPILPLVQKDKSYYFSSHIDKIPALLGSFDNLYFYMLDNLCKKLYVLTFENGSFHCDKDNDFISLPSDKYTKIELSRDGRTMVLHNPSCPTDDIAILKITR